MTKKSKVSASQIYLCVCILALLISAFIVAVVSEHGPVFAALKEKGMASEATVVSRRIDTVVETSSKGRKRERKRHFLTVSYDGASVTPHAVAAAGQPVKRGPNGVTVSGDIQVAGSEYDALAVGAKTLVTYLPNEMFKPRLTASVQAYTTVWQLLTAAILGVVGIWTAVLSWKKRTPKAAAQPLEAGAQ